MDIVYQLIVNNSSPILLTNNNDMKSVQDFMWRNFLEILHKITGCNHATVLLYNKKRHVEGI